MKIFLELLRIIRGFFGVIGAISFITGCANILDTNPQIMEAGIPRIIYSLVCLSLFGVLRWVINRLYQRQFGRAHPALRKDWNL
jgi:hypothetical protein